MSNPHARRWQDAARIWVEHGAMSLLGTDWMLAALATATSQLEPLKEQLAMIELSLSEIERVGVQGHERAALQNKRDERRRRRDNVDRRRALLERLGRLALARRPEPLRRWRVGCVARLDRAPVALAEMSELSWIMKGPVPLLKVIAEYTETLRSLARDADEAVVRAGARKALLQSAEDTFEASAARVELVNARGAMVPLILRALDAEMVLCRAVQTAREETFAPLGLAPPRDGASDDVVRVPERLWVRLVQTSSRFDAERDRRAGELIKAWPNGLKALHEDGSHVLDATMQLTALRPTDQR